MKRFKRNRKDRAAFTLIELLTSIVIIGILAGLITAAAMQAVTAAREASIHSELQQIDMAFRAYKEKFGEFPPDSAAAVERHLRKAFPRYNAANWKSDAAAWGISVNGYAYGDWITFWLGGKPIMNGSEVTGFAGFSANPSNPFDDSTSRIGPFYEFDPDQIINTGGRLRCWPKSAVSNVDQKGAMAYFRAENGSYDGKNWGPAWPAIDARSGQWINPESFQLWSSGLDLDYDRSRSGEPLQYPAGTNYGPMSFDDMANFTEGTLEDAMP